MLHMICCICQFQGIFKIRIKKKIVEENAVLMGMLDEREKGGQWDNAGTRQHYNLDTKASFQIARRGC